MPFDKSDRPRRPGGPGSSDGPRRPFRPRAEGAGDRPFRPRAEGDRPYAKKPFARGEGRGPDRGDRPYRPRAEGQGADRSDRPFRPRPDGDRPYSKKPFNRDEGGGSSYGKPAAGWRDRAPPRRDFEDRDERPMLKRASRPEPVTPVVSAEPAYAALAYRWRNHRLEPIASPHQVQLEDLLGIDAQKAALLQNTRQFVAGKPANHVLLTGARGTGKSSLVKALLSEFGGQGLRLVEVSPHDLTALPEIVAPLRGKPERHILYVDDFSVAANDPALTALKTALDGGIEQPPENVLIYATSNRRHLMPEMKRDNEEYHWVDDELHPGESTEEKISLSERFGLWLSFQQFSQAQYLDLVRQHLNKLGMSKWSETIEKEALRWALTRASRSGRVAQQFARDWAGRN